MGCFGICQEERLPYAFYISDEELVVQLGSYLEKNKGNLCRRVVIIIELISDISLNIYGDILVNSLQCLWKKC